MKGLLGKVFFLGVSIFVPVITIAVPVNNTVRRAKFMDFTDDVLEEMFDDVDPLPAVKKLNSKGKGYQTNATAPKTPVIVTPLSAAKRRSNKTNQMRTNEFTYPLKRNETFAQDNTEKFEVFTTPVDYFSYPLNFTQPVTQKTIVVYEGLEESPESPGEVAVDPYGVNSTEQLKILWNSVGGAVEQIPFLPVQLNVPDLIAAMANFLVAYLPFMNRITNVNNPRLPTTTNKTRRAKPQIHYFENTDFLPLSQHSGTRREYRVRADGTLSKKRIKNKRKSDKKKNAEKRNAQKKIFQIPSFTLRSTTAAPEDTKFFGLGNDQKETYRWKNMPITRKKIRVADKEIFNFKNSDINNSPIMILNVPQRPITHFKVYHQIPIVPTAMPKNSTGSSTGKPSMPSPSFPNIPIPIPGLPFPLPIPGGLAGLIPGLGGTPAPPPPPEDKPTEPTYSLSIPGIGGIAIPGIGSINIGTTGSAKPNATVKDEVTEVEETTLKQPEKIELKQRRKLKAERKAKKSLKRGIRLPKVGTDFKNDSAATVP